MVQSNKIVNDRNACSGPVVRFHSRPQADPWLEDDIEAVIRGLKAQQVGEIDVAGPELAGSLTNLDVKIGKHTSELQSPC